MATFDRNTSLMATLKERAPLTKDRSSKQTWHVTLTLPQKGLEYHPGDSVGIFPQNDPVLVEHLIKALQADPQARIWHSRSGAEMSLEHFLSFHANLSRLTSSFLKLIDDCPKIHHLLLPENKPLLRKFLAENDPLHLFRHYSNVNIPLQSLCDQFGPLLPRFYSIASSGRLYPETLDLTVSLFTWLQNEEKRYGVASHFLCHLAQVATTPIPLFFHPAPHFRLPIQPDTDIIMIGPGTGVAPFRAFLQERHFHEAQGKHWLFFGERNRDSDFLYENEWARFERLKLETAFSRDQKEKTYVQHKLLENAKELYGWLENGAHLYVCGDASQMAKDVDNTLVHIIASEANKNEEEARHYLKEMKKQKRYCLDVY